jgi:hypothetical protein
MHARGALTDDGLNIFLCIWGSCLGIKSLTSRQSKRESLFVFAEVVVNLANDEGGQISRVRRQVLCLVESFSIMYIRYIIGTGAERRTK